MSDLKTFRVVIAQSILTEVMVAAPDRSIAEDMAWERYIDPDEPEQPQRWLSDAIETVTIEEVQS